MGTSLFNTTPSATYPALIKVTDNTTLSTTLKTLSDGSGNDSALQLSTQRIGVLSDSSVTTETCSVIQATTTNANLVIAPNGTGALIASIPDGTATGGNARGDNAVDLQTVRGVNTQVAGGQAVIVGGSSNTAEGTQSVVVGGQGNRANTLQSFIGGGNANSILLAGENAIVGGTLNTNNGVYGFIGAGLQNTVSESYGVVSGGQSNTASGAHSTVSGGQTNTASSAHSTVSGGQTNTASTGTHTMVVGGSGNTSSGNYSISGGSNSTASGARSFAIGESALALGTKSVCLLGGSAQGDSSTALAGVGNNAISPYSLAQGYVTETNLRGQVAFSGTGYNFPFERGFCQQSTLVANGEATLITGGTTVLSLDGTGVTNLIIPNGTNRMWKVKVEYVGTITTITGTATGLIVGDTVYGEENFGFKKLAGTSTMGPIMNETQSSDNAIMDTCSLVVTAGASQEMALTFTGPTFAGGGSVTMRVVAKVALVEVAF